MQLLGAAEALEPIQEDARARQFDTLERLLDTHLGNGRQKPGLGHGRFKPAALVTKVQLGQFYHHGRARKMIRVVVHATRPHLDRSVACGPCGVVSPSAPASRSPPKAEPAVLRSDPPARRGIEEMGGAQGEQDWTARAAADSCAAAR